MKKKFLSLIIASLVGIGCLAGCASPMNNNGDDPSDITNPNNPPVIEKPTDEDKDDDTDDLPLTEDPDKYVQADGSITEEDQVTLAKIMFTNMLDTRISETTSPNDILQIDYSDFSQDGLIEPMQDEIYYLSRSMLYGTCKTYLQLLEEESTDALEYIYDVDYDIVFEYRGENISGFLTLRVPQKIYYISVLYHDDCYYLLTSCNIGYSQEIIGDIIIQYNPVTGSEYVDTIWNYKSVDDTYNYIDYIMFTDIYYPHIIEDTRSIGIANPLIYHITKFNQYKMNLDTDSADTLLGIMQDRKDLYDELYAMVGSPDNSDNSTRLFKSSLTLDDIERDLGIPYPRYGEEYEA